MAYKITGTVLAVSQPFNITSSKTGNTITKRDLIITVRLFDQYTGQPTEDSDNTPKFTFVGDRCRDLDQFKVGDIVTVDFDINGRAYNKDGRTEYFTEVRPFRAYLNSQQQQIAKQYHQPVTQHQQSQGNPQVYPQAFGQHNVTQSLQTNNESLPF